MNNTVNACSLTLLAWVVGCQKTAESDVATPAAPIPPAAPQALAPGRPSQAPAVQPASGRAVVQIGAVGTSGVAGELSLSALPQDAGVKFEGELTGLTPGNHGVHVHEVGSCDSPDGLSAGGHFNPTSAPHGALEAATSHVGDLGNCRADAHGKAVLSVIKGAARLSGPATLVGRSIIVHQDADDLKSQPAGKSGKRVGCGVIRAN